MACIRAYPQETPVSRKINEQSFTKRNSQVPVFLSTYKKREMATYTIQIGMCVHHLYV